MEANYTYPPFVEEEKAIPANGIRAFSDQRYDYYRLVKPLGNVLPAGTVFVHDKGDHVYGSLANGCLKLCWTPDGNCYRTAVNTGLCANTVILHARFADSDLFELAQKADDPIEVAIRALTQQRDLLSEHINELMKRRNPH